MSKKKSKRRPNPAFGKDMDRFLAQNVGRMLVTTQLLDWSYNECFVLAAFMPELHKLVKSFGSEALKKFVEKGPEVVIDI